MQTEFIWSVKHCLILLTAPDNGRGWHKPLFEAGRLQEKPLALPETRVLCNIVASWQLLKHPALYFNLELRVEIETNRTVSENIPFDDASKVTTRMAYFHGEQLVKTTH